MQGWFEIIYLDCLNSEFIGTACHLLELRVICNFCGYINSLSINNFIIFYFILNLFWVLYVSYSSILWYLSYITECSCKAVNTVYRYLNYKDELVGRGFTAIVYY